MGTLMCAHVYLAVSMSTGVSLCKTAQGRPPPSQLVPFPLGRFSLLGPVVLLGRV
jgi:hypothetical protein